MARKLRVQFAGGIYHVTVRGVNKSNIFLDKKDHERFIERLGEAVEEHAVRLYLFCLMANHIHLLIETPLGNLSAFMHKLQTAYTVYFNIRHKRTGHLTQGRFWAKPVSGDKYLFRLSRYIHLNPVFTETSKDQPLQQRLNELRNYSWSSYRGYAGLAPQFCFVDESPILAMTETTKPKQRLAYRNFVEKGLTETDEELAVIIKSNSWGIGGKEFQERVRNFHAELAEKTNRPEDISFRRILQKIDPDKIIAVIAAEFDIKPEDMRKRLYRCQAKAVSAMMLKKHGCMNQRDIATLLNIGTGSAVSKQLKELRTLLQNNIELDNCVKKIDLIIRNMSVENSNFKG